MFFGYGLATGSELESLKENTSDSKALKLYQTFQQLKLIEIIQNYVSWYS